MNYRKLILVKYSKINDAIRLLHGETSSFELQLDVGASCRNHGDVRDDYSSCVICMRVDAEL